MKLHRLSQAGDTIVEVLIAIAVVSLVLAAAYATSTRSAAATRDSQEHTEASQLLEQQVEMLRSDQTDALGTHNPYFCFYTDSSHNVTLKNFSQTPPASAAGDDLSSYPSPECINSYYHFSITQSTNPADNDLFTLRARWDNVSGGVDEVSLLYRLHQAEALAVFNPGSSCTTSDCTAKITDQTCGATGLPPCGAPPIPGRYNYMYKPQNLSAYKPGTVDHCTWQWDTTDAPQSYPASAPECTYGSFVAHVYPKLSPELPYPQECQGGDNRRLRTVTLTMYYIPSAGIAPQTDTKTIGRPNCVPTVK